MHRLPILLAVLLALVVPSALGGARSLVRLPPRLLSDGSPDAYVAGEVLVKFRPGASSAKVDPLAGALGLVREERLGNLGIERYRLAGGGDVLETVRRLRQRPDVLFAEPNGLAWPAAVPNDTYYANVDGNARDLLRWTFGGVDGNTGIDAEAAWDLTVGRPDVTIAVIDSGVDITNPDLASNVWTNLGEIPGNGIDDDANGFVDDVHGWDFFSSDNDASPDLGDGINNDGAGLGDDNTFHGTFVANLAAGRGGDGNGVLGAAWSCTVMPIKVFTDDGGANNFHIAAAFEYAADNGADVVNASLETRTDSSSIREGVAYAVAHDCVVVAAAGNEGSPSPVYPAVYDGVISVGASGHAFEGSAELRAFGPANFDGRPSFSNYGPAAVDVVAPGVVFSSSVASKADADADSSLHAGDVIGLAAEGTSFSSPIVAGLAALIVSRDKDLHGGVRTLTCAQIADIVQSTAVDLPDDPTDAPDGRATWDNHGRVDFVAALEAVPGGGSGRSVRLGWEAPSGGALAPPTDLSATEGAAKVAGTRDPVVAAYRVYRATTPGVPRTVATRIAQVAGTQLSFVDTGAPEGDVYYVVTAIYGADDESAASNEASPGAPNPDAPVILNPAYKKGKLTLDATNSKIVAGTILVVDDAQTFALAASADGGKWIVKKKSRSAPGGLRIADALVAGQAARLVVVTPSGLRSAAVTFTR
jgi:subtilisin family serine protease